MYYVLTSVANEFYAFLSAVGKRREIVRFVRERIRKHWRERGGCHLKQEKQGLKEGSRSQKYPVKI